VPTADGESQESKTKGNALPKAAAHAGGRAGAGAGEGAQGTATLPSAHAREGPRIRARVLALARTVAARTHVSCWRWLHWWPQRFPLGLATTAHEGRERRSKAPAGYDTSQPPAHAQRMRAVSTGGVDDDDARRGNARPRPLVCCVQSALKPPCMS